MALGEEGEDVALIGDILNKGSRRRESCRGTPTVPDRKQIRTRSLDSFGFTDVTLMKVDVESWELAVLRGGMETIKRDKPSIVIEFLAENRAEYDAFFAKELPEYERAYTVELEQTGRQDIIFVAEVAPLPSPSMAAVAPDAPAGMLPSELSRTRDQPHPLRSAHAAT